MESLKAGKIQREIQMVTGGERSRKRAGMDIYQDTHPSQRAYFYRKPTDTGCIQMRVDISAG